MSTSTWVLFVVAAAAGAVLRYLVDGAVSARDHGAFPWGTFLINVSGCLLLGVITGLALFHGLGPDTKLVAGTGFCGAFTTFSTFAYETVRLAEEGSLATAARNAAGTLLAGAAAATLGLLLAAL